MSGCSHQHPSSLCSMSSTEGEDAHHFSSTTQSTTEAKIDPGPTPSTSSKAGEPCALAGEDPNTPAAHLPSWDSYSEGIRRGTRCRPLCGWRVLVSHRKVLCASHLGGGGRGLLPELGRALHFAPLPVLAVLWSRGAARCGNVATTTATACFSCRDLECRRCGLTAPSPLTCVGRQPCSSVIGNAHKEVTQVVRACGCFSGGDGGFCVAFTSARVVRARRVRPAT